MIKKFLANGMFVIISLQSNEPHSSISKYSFVDIVNRGDQWLSQNPPLPWVLTHMQACGFLGACFSHYLHKLTQSCLHRPPEHYKVHLLSLPTIRHVFHRMVMSLNFTDCYRSLGTMSFELTPNISFHAFFSPSLAGIFQW